MSELKTNLENVRRRISEAAERAGRDPGEICLIAVSKTKPLEMIQEMAALGQQEFGENYVSELVEKQEAFPDVSYHMIGHLQTNKVKKILGKTVLIHSVDSWHLAETISREAGKKGIIQPILLEINGGNEPSKYGFSFEEAEDALRKIAALPGIRIEGLMGVAPDVDDPEENRVIFRKLFQLSVDIGEKNIDNVRMKILSMGMTNDFETAIEEGATHVRIGTALFGKRIYRGDEL